MDAAGLVLGVIPLAIQALGTYRDIVSSMKNAKRDLDCLIRDLNTEQQILQNTCETLLRGIVPDSMLDDMIEDPFGPDWAHYNDEVRLRLWRSADLFQEQVEEMMQAAMQLRRKLAIGHNGKTPRNLVDIRFFLDEVKHSAYFTLKKKDYNEILSRLKEGNAVLSTLANQNSNLEPSRRSRSQARLARLVRNLSQGIYAALQTVITCRCTGFHNLGLEMASRKDVLLPGDEEDKTAKSLDFCVALGSHARKPPQRWDKIRVQMAPDELALPAPSITRDKYLLRSRSSRNLRRQSRLPLQTRLSNSATSAQSTPHLPISSQIAVKQPSAVITNLCSTLHQGQRKGKGSVYYGYILNKTCKFNLFQQDAQPQNLSALTLGTILDTRGSGGEQRPLTYGDRLRVALALSYSVLHLYNTPWLARVVTSDDIVFLREQQTQTSHRYSMDRPFLVKTLPGIAANACRSSPKLPPQDMWSRPLDPTILSLGLLLIQIIVGHRIQNLALDPDAGSIDAILEKQSAASQMTGSVLESGGMNYAAVVQWCLESVLRGAHLDDEKVGQEFHEAVITRLEADMRLQASMTTPS